MNGSDEAKVAFAKRLNETLTEKGYIQRGRAQRLKREAGFSVSDRAINKWLNAETLPDHYNIEALARFLGVNFNWLAAGQGIKETKGSSSEVLTESKEELARILEAGTVSVDDSDDDMVLIPIYDIYFCCGDGNGSCEFENIKGYRKLPPDFFKDRNIRPEDFKLICAVNDSNHPYIKDGDEVGIVITDREIKDGEYYAILLDGDRMIKQIFREAGGAYRLSSFNKAYPDKVVTPEHSESLIIAGRQVYRAG
ncbi:MULTISPECIES: S24 family peptidase [Psychrobacter]|uniref:S24 family peptidase n=1 Tax=Psychrobacter TaxID=497 RepID=UPI000ED781DF|nr:MULTISPECIES: LexA family transcriptional regulator [Psychrobacter]HCR88817.1 hypothetical protein [Psychrobacter sp.]